MRLSQLQPLPEYFDRYILKCDDIEMLEAIEKSIREISKAPLEKWNKVGDFVYAPGKWTIRDILQHLIDTERIFTYRALAFARNERGQVLSYTEDEYAKEANAGMRTLEDLLAELKAVHQSFKAMFASFSTEMLLRTGMGFKGPYSVGSIGFMMPGHQRWHFEMIERRYCKGK